MFFRHIKTSIILVCFVAIGVFLRAYHHAEWLPFELDQSRDALIVMDIMETGQLPLLGPQARSSDLLLGPVFYYFQAFAAKIFGNHPHVLAWPDLFFSIATIPLFYFFLRFSFSRYLSLGLTGIAALSLFFVTYGRFAWNPNALPFFTLLFCYSLFHATHPKGREVQTGWFLLAVASMAIATQLHFIAFLSLPIILVAYFLLTRSRLAVRQVLFALAVAGLLYMPVLISEWRTGGANARAFLETVSNKGGENDNHDVLEKTFRLFQETARLNWAVVFADQETDIIKTKPGQGGYSFSCDSDCRKRLPHTAAAWVFFVGLIFALWKTLREKETTKERLDFLIVLALWIAVPFTILIPLAYQFSPRFLLVFVLPLVALIGLGMEMVLKYTTRYGVTLAIGLFALAYGLNLFALFGYFKELSHATTEPSSPHRDLIMQRSETVTLEQLLSIVKYIEEQHVDGVPVFLVGDNRYARSLYYLGRYESSLAPVCYTKASSFNETDRYTLWLVVKRSSSDPVPSEILSGHTVELRQSFGSLLVFSALPKTGDPVDSLPHSCFTY